MECPHVELLLAPHDGVLHHAQGLPQATLTLGGPDHHSQRPDTKGDQLAPPEEKRPKMRLNKGPHIPKEKLAEVKSK